MGLLDLLLNDSKAPAAAAPSGINEDAILDQEIMLMLSSIQPTQEQAAAEPSRQQQSSSGSLDCQQLLSNMLAASNSLSSCSTACNSPSSTMAVSGAQPDPPCSATGLQQAPLALQPPPVSAQLTQPAAPAAAPGPTQPDCDLAGVARGCCGKRKSMELSSSSAGRKLKPDAAKAAKMKKHLEQVQEQLVASESSQVALRQNVAVLQAENMALLERVAQLTDKWQRTVEDNAELYRHVITLEQQLQVARASGGRRSSPPSSGADNSGLAALFLQLQQQ